MAKLSDAEIQTALTTLPGWTYANGVLSKTFSLPTFADAIALVNGAAERAEEQGHHPDMDIRYNRVIFTLATHDEGGVTAKDIALAHAIDQQAQFNIDLATHEGLTDSTEP